MTDTTTTPGPKCTICTHPQLESIQAALMAGTGVVEISGSYGVSTSALSRHTQQHLQPALREQARDTTAAPADLLQRLVEVADDARAARLRARDSGTPSAQARATDVEIKVLQSLLGHYGIDSGATVVAMAEAEKLAHAVGRFALANPLAAQVLILEIQKQGLDEFGQQLDALTKKSIGRD